MVSFSLVENQTAREDLPPRHQATKGRLTGRTGTGIVYLDPKRVESQLYSGIANPDIMRIASTNEDILKELTMIHSWMEDRYQYMANRHIRDAMSKWLENHDENLKPMVLICDEVGDMFSEIPAAKNILLSLSSRSRAAGLRIFLATQRPDAKIIDGAIKANFTTRICFKTSSRIDSSIILGFGGGEHLRGKGHGILLSNDNSITTFKGAVIEGIRLSKYSTTDTYCPAAAAPVVLDSIRENLGQLKKLK
jgi:S-DNA-T family DNA segregation ATPase FtsK/SpoIIIE